jgi:hypothetical protein
MTFALRPMQQSMARKKPKVNLSQPIQPRTGDLSQLFSTATDTEQAAGMQLLAIRTETIVPDPEQPRRTFPKRGCVNWPKAFARMGSSSPSKSPRPAPSST